MLIQPLSSHLSDAHGVVLPPHPGRISVSNNDPVRFLKHDEYLSMKHV